MPLLRHLLHRLLGGNLWQQTRQQKTCQRGDLLVESFKFGLVYWWNPRNPKEYYPIYTTRKQTHGWLVYLYYLGEVKTTQFKNSSSTSSPSFVHHLRCICFGCARCFPTPVPRFIHAQGKRVTLAQRQGGPTEDSWGFPHKLPVGPAFPFPYFKRFFWEWYGRLEWLAAGPTIGSPW